MRVWVKACLCVVLGAVVSNAALAQHATGAPAPVALPTGQSITPLAAPGAHYTPLVTRVGPHPDTVADGAAAVAASPDGRTLLVLTSGFNRFNNQDGSLDAPQSQQYIFVYGMSGGGATWRQSIPIPNAFFGLAWRPDGRGFYVSGGVDDAIVAFERGPHGFAQSGAAIALGHRQGLGLEVKPQTAGLAVSPDGSLLLAANYYNDSVSLIDAHTNRLLSELDLRPGRIDAAQHGTAGGEFPLAVVWRDNGRAYVSSPRDRQIVALSVSANAASVASRITLHGEPTNLLVDARRHRLYGVEDNDDALLVVDSDRDTLIGEPRLGLPEVLGGAGLGHGVNPNSLALMPGSQSLLVTYGGANALAIVALNDAQSQVVGLIPTGWYPSAVATSADGRRIFIANRKSPPGPNPQGCQPRTAVVHGQPTACNGANQYVFQLEKAGLLTLPAPSGATLARLTQQTGDNIGVSSPQGRAQAEAVMTALRAHIQHVIFIVKENRTYDQVLGDLAVGNGDPRLAILGEGVSPNHHDLARQFVTFDNFYDSGEQSSTGWNWSTAARATDLMERTAAVNYAGRGLAYEAEGTNRNLNMGLAPAERRRVIPFVPDDPDLLPGTANLTSPDGDGDGLAGQGFIWDAALRAGLSVRNYGFANDLIYELPAGGPSLAHDPAQSGEVVFHATYAALADRSDPYFRGFDQRYPDYWRVREWIRDFDLQIAQHAAPALTLLRISHDHFGDFDKAIDGVNTVETEMADNDYALGMIVEHIAQSPIRDSTLIFVIEDDAQNGADHVDAHRSVAFIAGPYVRQHALVSTRYTTVNIIRTMGAILGLRPLGLNDALAAPMADAFDPNQTQWNYRARTPSILRTTALPLPPQTTGELAPSEPLCVSQSPAYWALAMRGQNFSVEDRLDTDAFNAALWRGLAPAGATQPAPDGRDLRANRDQLLSGAAAPRCAAANIGQG
jgi:DNA-binding beta-propeller fold protein YncE